MYASCIYVMYIYVHVYIIFPNSWMQSGQQKETEAKTSWLPPGGGLQYRSETPQI